MKKFTSILILAITLLSSITGCKKEDSVIKQLPSNYSNQGTITVKNKTLTVCVYDNSAEDGDVLDLIVNGSTILSNYEILNTEKCLTSTVSDGDNWIGVIARSEGSAGNVCSATITVNDGISTQSFSIDAKIDQPGGYIIKL